MLAGTALLLLSCCEEGETDVFERRYSLTQIPTFEAEDHIALLDHKDPNIRYLALANLLQMGALAQPDEDREMNQPIKKLGAKMRSLLADPAPKVRAIAAYAPINRAGEGAEERLLALLDDGHSAVRVEAVVSLGATGSQVWKGQERSGKLTPAGTERVASLLDDTNVLVRLHALEALGSAASPQSADAVVRQIELALARREAPEVLKALEVLGQIESDEAEKILLGRLDDDDARIVGVAITSLASRRSPALEEWLITALAKGREPAAHLLENLAMIATTRSRATAISMLDHPEADVRSQCGAILERIGDQASFDALAAALRGVTERPALPAGGSGSEEEEMIELLMRIRTVGEKLGTYTFDREGLQTLLHSPRQHDQLVAIVHLAEENAYDAPFLEFLPAGDADFLAPLEALTNSQSPLTRLLAYQALAKSGNLATGDVLVAGVIADPVFKVRFAALEALVDYTATTGRRTPLRSVCEQRSKFEPSTYKSDDPNLLMRERIEQAIRQFEPSWESVARAQAELRSGKKNASGLLAAAFLAPRKEAMDVLLDALATGAEGAKTFALRTIDTHAEQQHVNQLRKILAVEKNPDRQKALAKIIAKASG